MKFRRKNANRHSARLILSSSFIVLLVVLILISVSYGIYSIHTYEKVVLDTTQKQLAAYGERLSEELSSLAAFNREFVANDADFNLLSFANCSDNQKVLLTYNIRRIITSRTLDYEAMVLYDPVEKGLYYYFGNAASRFSQGAQKGEFVKSILGSLTDSAQQHREVWIPIKGSGECYSLMLVNRNRNLHLASMINLDAYLQINEIPTFSPSSIPVILFNDRILVHEDTVSALGITAEDILYRDGEWISKGIFDGYICKSVQVPESGMMLAVLIPLGDVIREIGLSLTFFLLVIILIAVALAAAYRVLLKFLYYPIEEVAEMSKKLENADMDLRTPSSNFVELDAIKESIVNLLDQKSNLEKEKANQVMEKERALFQFYQLQTRSHFFINCLKSLFNMTEKGDKGKMQTMIMAFSNHLRYTFRDGMQEVALSEELHEISDYLRIISLDAAMPVIMTCNVPDSLMDVFVPPLIIQTFLENTYKYNGKSEGSVTFSVDVSEATLDGEEYIRIRTMDNGVGYPPELLRIINSEPEGSFDTYNVGLNNLKRRVKIMYKNKCQFAFYNSGSGACSSIYLPKHKERIQL